MQSAAEEVGQAIEQELAQGEETYHYPPITLLEENRADNCTEVGAELRNNSRRLAEALRSFGVDAAAGDVVHGPSVTRYEFTLEQGVKLSKITNLSDDIALALGASGVRVAPVPNKISVVGIEVPNRTVTAVRIRDVIESREFTRHPSPVAFAVGKDIGGNNIVGNIARLPHVLIAGTTGSGKSVCTNSLIVSILYKSTPDEVRFIMVDPKMVELAPYNGIPHLLIPVVTDPKKAAGALQWAVFEMMKRYKMFSEKGVKDLAGYNALSETDEDVKKLPTVVVVIDELADLMLVAAKEVEESICRVAQMGRAAGMHLVVATQRPSADVITGLMKANIPSRIAFAVASSMESRIILDTPGAEKLVGKGDMLYSPLGDSKPTRVQGCFITPEEIERVVAFVKDAAGEAHYDQDVIEKIQQAVDAKADKGKSAPADTAADGEDGDELLPAAVEVVLETGQASVSMLQRRLKLGYSRAARLVDQMEERGYVGPFEGSKPRQLLITREKWQELQMAKGIAPHGDAARPGSLRLHPRRVREPRRPGLTAQQTQKHPQSYATAGVFCAFLQSVGLVDAEALAQYLIGVAHDDERIGIGVLHDGLDADDLRTAEGAQDHVFGPAAEAAPSLQQCDAPVQLQQLGGDGLVLLGDDVGHLRAVAAVDHPVHHLGDDEQRHHGVQRLGQVAEHRGVGDDHDGVDGQAQRADGQPREFQLQQPGRQLGAAGGGAVPQHQAAAEAHDDAAVDGRQHRLHGPERVQPGQQVDHAGADQRGVQRGVQPLAPHLFPAQDKQRQVQHHDHRTDGCLRDEKVDDLGHTGKAAHAQVVGVKAPVEAHGVQRAGQGDHGVLPHDPLQLLIHKQCPSLHSILKPKNVYTVYYAKRCLSTVVIPPPQAERTARWRRGAWGAG